MTIRPRWVAPLLASLVACAPTRSPEMTALSQAASSWTLVNSSAPGYSTVSSRSCASMNNAEGDLLAVYAYVNSSSVTLSVNDTAGNVWSQTPLSTFAGAQSGQQWFYAVAKSSGANTLTVKQSSSSVALGLFCFEYAGNAPTGVFDVSQAANASGGTASMSSGSFVTTGSSDLILTGFDDVGTGGPFTAAGGARALAQDDVFAAMAESESGVGPGSYTATASDSKSSGSWQAYAVAFKSSGGSGGAQTLTVSKAGSGSGTVTSSPSGIECGSTCSASFATGTVVTLSASPASASSFAGWSGACSGTGSCTVTLNAAQSVTATFDAQASGAWTLVNSSLSTRTWAPPR
jgi:hypothetical protein